MEKKTITRPEYAYFPPVITGYSTKTVFVASDGMEFTRKDACVRHEKDLEIYSKYKSIKKFTENNGIETDGIWFFAQNEEELNLIQDRHNDGTRHFYGEIKPQSWLVIRLQDGGDHENQIYYESLEYIKERWNNLLFNLEENDHEKMD